MTWKASVLVVANVTAASDELVEALRTRAERGPTEFTLLVPATGGGSAGREAARASLDAALERIAGAGLEAGGTVGDPDPVVAVHETWDPGRFDEIVVATLPATTSRWLLVDLPHRIERMTDAQVTHVVASPPPRPHSTSPAPPKPRHLGVLSPLEVLGWGRGERRPSA
jgi:hypothetical protein